MANCSPWFTLRPFLMTVNAFYWVNSYMDLSIVPLCGICFCRMCRPLLAAILATLLPDVIVKPLYQRIAFHILIARLVFYFKNGSSSSVAPGLLLVSGTLSEGSLCLLHEPDSCQPFLCEPQSSRETL